MRTLLIVGLFSVSLTAHAGLFGTMESADVIQTEIAASAPKINTVADPAPADGSKDRTPASKTESETPSE